MSASAWYETPTPPRRIYQPPTSHPPSYHSHDFQAATPAPRSASRTGRRNLIDPFNSADTQERGPRGSRMEPTPASNSRRKSVPHLTRNGNAPPGPVSIYLDDPPPSERGSWRQRVCRWKKCISVWVIVFVVVMIYLIVKLALQPEWCHGGKVVGHSCFRHGKESLE